MLSSLMGLLWSVTIIVSWRWLWILWEYSERVSLGKWTDDCLMLTFMEILDIFSSIVQKLVLHK